MIEIGAIERRRQNEFPGSVDYELGTAGRELLLVADVLRDWLSQAPDGPVRLGSVGAKSAIKALVEGWSSTIIRALASAPLSLTDLNRLISRLNYPSLERRLGALRLTGQIEACPTEGRSTPYVVSAWLRQAAGALIAAIQWERRWVGTTTAPLTKLDTEALFLLAVPQLNLPADLSGNCRLAVELRNSDGDYHLGGALVDVREGRVVGCSSRLQGDAGAWASGSASAWLDALTKGDTGRLEVGGDTSLALTVIEGLNESLFGVKQSR